jgi:hypothetical protein
MQFAGAVLQETHPSCRLGLLPLASWSDGSAKKPRRNGATSAVGSGEGIESREASADNAQGLADHGGRDPPV